MLFSGTSSALWKRSRGGFEEERRGMEIMIGGGTGREETKTKNKNKNKKNTKKTHKNKNKGAAWGS